jgi:hypothetical protein
MRWLALALVIASASCPHHEPPHDRPLCSMEHPEYLVPCRLYVMLRDDYGEARNVPAVRGAARHAVEGEE